MTEDDLLSGTLTIAGRTATHDIDALLALPSPVRPMDVQHLIRAVARYGALLAEATREAAELAARAARVKAVVAYKTREVADRIAAAGHGEAKAHKTLTREMVADQARTDPATVSAEAEALAAEHRRMLVAAWHDALDRHQRLCALLVVRDG